MFFDQRGSNFGIWNFRDLTATRMTINAGNVGIGTTSPDNTLDLGSPSQGRGLTFDNYSIFSFHQNYRLHRAELRYC